jgi:hypothetical protein
MGISWGIKSMLADRMRETNANNGTFVIYLLYRRFWWMQSIILVVLI